jgi:hypothetical protein
MEIVEARPPWVLKPIVDGCTPHNLPHCLPMKSWLKFLFTLVCLLSPPLAIKLPQESYRSFTNRLLKILRKKDYSALMACCSFSDSGPRQMALFHMWTGTSALSDFTAFAGSCSCFNFSRCDSSLLKLGFEPPLSLLTTCAEHSGKFEEMGGCPCTCLGVRDLLNTVCRINFLHPPPGLTPPGPETVRQPPPSSFHLEELHLLVAPRPHASSRGRSTSPTPTP